MKFSRSTAMSAALALIATGAIGAVGVVTAPAAMAATTQPRSNSGLLYTLDDTIPVRDAPNGIAFLDNTGSADDSIYVVDSGSTPSTGRSLSVINATTNTVDDTVSFASVGNPQYVAIGQDDTVYVSTQGPALLAAVNPLTNTVDDTAVMGAGCGNPAGVTLVANGSGQDDSVYVNGGFGQTDVCTFNAASLGPGPSITGTGGTYFIASSRDDTVYATGAFASATGVRVIAGASVATTLSAGLPSKLSGVTVSDDDTLFVAGWDTPYRVFALNAKTNVIDDSGAIPFQPTAVAYDPIHLKLYVAPSSGGTIAVFDSQTLELDDTVAVPGGGTMYGIVVSPDGSRVYATSNTGDFVAVISVASPTPPPPPPPPAEPPGPPVNVGGVPGDRQVAVTWDPPSSSGSFPISTYQVETRPYDEEPISNSCLATAPALTCTVTGLTNGKPYVFRVRALSGAGWGPWSKESPQVTPRKETEPTYAVIKELPTGRNAWGVAVNNTTDAVYVTNREGRSVSTYDGQSGTPASTIAVGDTPVGVAVNQNTGSVYVANFGLSPSPYTRTLVKIDGATGTISGSIPLNGRPYSVAINDRTNTIYATSNASASGGSFFIVDGDTDSVIKRLTLPSGEGGIAVDRIDDTVYVANPYAGANSVSVIDGRTNAISGNPIKVGVEPTGVAIDQTDDTVFVTNRGFSNNGTTMSVINTRTRDVGSVTVGKAPLFLAVDSANHLAYVPNLFSGTVSLADTRTQIVQHTMAIESPRAVAVDEAGPNAGVAYVTRGGNKLAVVANAEPSLVTRTGKSGDMAVLDVDVPQAAYLVDDATVQGITFGGVAATILGRVAGKDQWRVQVPEGSGTVPVVVTFNGGLSAPAGPFTYVPDPTPKEPRDVTGEPGDGEVTVTWKEPESPGDSPITEYEVVSEPDGKTCTVTAPTLTCTIPGLRNGIPYTFKVRAKNGSGWGPYSDPTPVIIPVGPAPQPGTPGVPRDVNETPGPQEILVTWKEPEDPGDGPILEYIATVHPSGKTCRVPVPQLSCRIPGLEDGVPYEVTVVAVNGNGAGKPTPPGAPVTPAADAVGIVITGDRDDARKPNGLVTVEGLTTGIAVGTQLTAYTRTSSTGTYKAGAKVTVNIGGNFTWKREVKRGKDLQVYFAEGSTTSNTLALPARTITITGSRDNSTATKGKNRVTIKGTSVNVPAGTKLVARVTTKRGGPYTDGVTVTVAANGTFTWKREVNKGKTLWVYFIGGKAISNTLKFPPT